MSNRKVTWFKTTVHDGKILNRINHLKPGRHDIVRLPRLNSVCRRRRNHVAVCSPAAIYNYDPSGEHELRLQVGDTVHILEKLEGERTHTHTLTMSSCRGAAAAASVLVNELLSSSPQDGTEETRYAGNHTR